MAKGKLHVGPRGGVYRMVNGKKVYTSETTEEGGMELQVGPRGGQYYLSPSGRKIYVQKPRVKSARSSRSGRTMRSGRSRKTWINPDSKLSSGQQKYCRCVLEVASKQSDQCLKNIAQRKKGTYGPGTDCFNVWSVCAASTGTSTGRAGCSKDYNFNEMPDEFIIAYLKLHGKNVPSSKAHADLVAAAQSAASK